MSILQKTLGAAFVFLSMVTTFSGCQTSGNTTRLDFNYEKPVWTEASDVKTAHSKHVNTLIFR